MSTYLACTLVVPAVLRPYPSQILVQHRLPPQTSPLDVFSLPFCCSGFEGEEMLLKRRKGRCVIAIHVVVGYFSDLFVKEANWGDEKLEWADTAKARRYSAHEFYGSGL